MKKERLFIILSFIILSLLLVVFIITNKPTYDLAINNNLSFNIRLRSNKEKSFNINVLDYNTDLVINNLNNKYNSNYFKYILRDNTGSIIDKGIFNGSDNSIDGLDKGLYNMSIIYSGDNSFDLSFDLGLINHPDTTYSTLVSGVDIHKHIDMLTGRKDVDYTVRAIKIAKELDDRYDDDKYLVSTSNSDPIYLWLDGDTLYFYSINKISLNEYSDFLFDNLVNLVDINDMKYFDTTKVISMSNMFNGDSNLSDIKALANFNTTRVNNMNSMFKDCELLRDITSLIGFDTRNVSDFNSFLFNTSVSDISVLKYFDLGSTTDISFMFAGTDISDITALDNWDTSSVLSSSYTFYGTNISNLDSLSKWDVSNITDMSSMFSNCIKLNNIDGISRWNTKSLEDMSYMFSYIDINNLDSLSKWNTSNLLLMDGVFYHIRNLKNIDGISNFFVSNVSSMRELFSYTNVSNIDSIKKWDTSKVEDFSNIFYNSKVKDYSEFIH